MCRTRLKTNPQRMTSSVASKRYRLEHLAAEGAADAVPSDVEASILPTTLFGQKYISLSGPRRPSQQPIAEGDVVPSERVTTAVELNRVLDQLFPLLRAIRPADLNATLNALATALGGRGEEIGRQTFSIVARWPRYRSAE